MGPQVHDGSFLVTGFLIDQVYCPISEQAGDYSQRVVQGRSNDGIRRDPGALPSVLNKA